MSLSVLDNVYYGFHLGYKTADLEAAGCAAVGQERGARVQADAARRSSSGWASGTSRTRSPRICPTATEGPGHLHRPGDQPKLLLLDEPMTGMNQTEIATDAQLVRGIRDSGITIAMIEHNMTAVMSLCDRIVVLDHGQKIAEGLPEGDPEERAGHRGLLGKDELLSMSEHGQHAARSQRPDRPLRQGPGPRPASRCMSTKARSSLSSAPTAPARPRPSAPSRALKQPASGEIWFDGQADRQDACLRVMRLGIVQVPAGRQIFQTMSVLDNLKVGAHRRKDREGIKRDLEIGLRALPHPQREEEPSGRAS